MKAIVIIFIATLVSCNSVDDMIEKTFVENRNVKLISSNSLKTPKGDINTINIYFTKQSNQFSYYGFLNGEFFYVFSSEKQLNQDFILEFLEKIVSENRYGETKKWIPEGGEGCK